jgi:ceroid-lipofuscinosis neuronal protein 6
VTEGQITPLFVVSLTFMYVFYFYNHFIVGRLIDENGMFLITTFQLTIVLVGIWCWYFWEDAALRKKYPGLIYVPEPWSVYSLHFKEYYNIF